MDAMQGQPVILVAAGVAVMNGAGELLLLRRPDGEWDLPGGHMEAGESLLETATRELFEETGFAVDVLEMFGLASGKDTFYPKRNAYYVTAVYLAKGEGAARLSPEHTDAEFFALGAFPDTLSVTARWVTTKLGETGVSER